MTERIQEALVLALASIPGSVTYTIENERAEKRFWEYLLSEFKYDPHEDDEFAMWALKATQAETIAAALARVVGIPAAHVVWDAQPWTRTTALDAYADHIGGMSKMDLVETAIENISDADLLEFMLVREELNEDA